MYLKSILWTETTISLKHNVKVHINGPGVEVSRKNKLLKLRSIKLWNAVTNKKTKNVLTNPTKYDIVVVGIIIDESVYNTGVETGICGCGKEIKH